MSRDACWPLAMALFLVVGSEARADRIVLRGGTEIRGVVLPDAQRPTHVLVQTETGPKPLAFAKEQVLRVVAESSALDGYLARREQVADTAEAHHDLGLWCEEKKLTGPAQAHFQRAVELDPNHAPAHKKLGHVLHGQRWMTYDQQREAQGLVKYKYKGKWVSQQEKERLDSQVAFSAQQATWSKRIAPLRQAFLAGGDDRRSQAEEQLSAIREPAAVKPLVQAFGQGPEPARALLDRVLGGIPGPEASAALLARVLAEANATVRGGALDELARREEPETAAKLIAALRSPNPVVVGRAAWALASLNVTSAVPKLVPVLVKVERKLVVVRASTGQGPAGISAGFTSAAPATPTLPAGDPTIQRSQPVLTGPVVAPGVVAFGATQVPYDTSGFSLSGGNSDRLVPRVVSRVHRNPEVLDALERLTGQNFGYDSSAWRRWLKNAPKPEGTPVRRVPQP